MYILLMYTTYDFKIIQALLTVDIILAWHLNGLNSVQP